MKLQARDLGAGHYGQKIAKATITGEQGIALIQRRVLEMGLVWHQRQVGCRD